VKIMPNSLEKAIGDRLRKKKWTLSIAESCTGGLICDRITNVSGSSDYFMGGMVNYSNESKSTHLGVPSNDIKKYGAVSPHVAEKMAQGVRKLLVQHLGYRPQVWRGPQAERKELPLEEFHRISQRKKNLVEEIRLKGEPQTNQKRSCPKSPKIFL